MTKASALLSLFLLLSSPAGANGTSLTEELLKHRLAWDATRGLSLTKSSSHAGETLNFLTLIADGPKTHLEVNLTDPIDPEHAERSMNLRYLSIEALYSSRNTPYFGALTNISDCPPDKKPKEVRLNLLGKERKVLLLNASGNFAFGVWDKEEVKQRAAFLMIYDETKKVLIEIKVFRPLGAFSEPEVLKLLEGLHDT